MEKGSQLSPPPLGTSGSSLSTTAGCVPLLSDRPPSPFLSAALKRLLFDFPAFVYCQKGISASILRNSESFWSVGGKTFK